MKFRAGERVKVRRDLVVGEKYFMEDGINCEIFSHTMRNNLDKEATIIEVNNLRGYRLDIDTLPYFYTDGMLNKFVDVKAKTEEVSKRDKGEVDALIEHMLKLTPEQMINHALDTGDKELFDKLTMKG